MKACYPVILILAAFSLTGCGSPKDQEVTYQMRGLDGQTYRIVGPPGKTREEIEIAILARAPQAGIPRPSYGEDGSLPDATPDYAGPQRARGTSLYSDGTTAQRVGNTTFYSDGTTAQRVGNSTFYSDGTTAQQVGNSTFYSDGTTAQRVGDTTFYSGGTTCQTIGSMEFCN